jgi:hypothetical protein
VSTTVLIWYLRKRTKNSSVKLFHAALKDENSGEFASAIQQYETALNEAEKNGFDVQLRSRIIEKLKVLHTITEYEKDMRQQARIFQIDTTINKSL